MIWITALIATYLFAETINRARETIIKLAQDAGMKAWHAGRIDNSAAAEALTSVLIFINGAYKINSAGISIIGEQQLIED